LQAEGEKLPFDDASFEIVLSDNVVDHAEDPRRIVEEIARVLAPGGLFYFTVHVHHPLYHVTSVAYGLWRRLGLPGEITPFADHGPSDSFLGEEPACRPAAPDRPGDHRSPSRAQGGRRDTAASRR
jgi:SAM-dependent methyltransferase